MSASPASRNTSTRKGLQDLNGAGLATQASDLKPVQLSIDLRVQHLVRDELLKGIEKYRAIAAAGAIMDVNTGEVIALVSLPDYDPGNPVDAQEKDRINRMNVGVYEMGSTFKALTIAMALDSGKANINSSYSTAGGMMRFGRQVIKEYHGTGRTLTVPEVFLHSSNMGSIKMALSVGVEGHKAFLRKMMQLDRMTDRAARERRADRSAALGRDQHRDDRLRPRPRRGADPGDGGGRRAGQWRLR